MRLLPASVALALPLVLGCGGATPTPTTPPATAASAVAPDVVAPGHLRRRDVLGAIDAGLGTFLGKVEVDAVVVGGKFRGWKIVSFAFEGGVDADLKPGDVVLRVNDRPVERPEQADVAFRSLAIARELRIAYERDGQLREVKLEIDEDGAKPAAPAASARTVAATASSAVAPAAPVGSAAAPR